MSWVVCVCTGLAAWPPPPLSPACATSVLRLPGVTFRDTSHPAAAPWGHGLSARGPLTACLWFSFQAERPALNVVVFPLLHEGLTDVIRDVPMVHLDEVTLFKSRVAEEPPNLWW